MFNSKVLKTAQTVLPWEHLKMKCTQTHTRLPEVYYKFLQRTLMMRVSNWVFVILPRVTLLSAVTLKNSLSPIHGGILRLFPSLLDNVIIHTTVRQSIPVQYFPLTPPREPIGTRSLYFVWKGKIASVDDKQCESIFFRVKISTHVIHDT